MKRDDIYTADCKRWYHGEEIRGSERWKRRGMTEHADFIAAELQRAYEKGRQHANDRLQQQVGWIKTRLLDFLEGNVENQQFARAVFAARAEASQDLEDTITEPSLPQEPYTLPIYSGSPAHQQISGMLRGLEAQAAESTSMALHQIADEIQGQIDRLQELEGHSVTFEENPRPHTPVDPSPYCDYADALHGLVKSCDKVLGFRPL